MSYKGKGKRPAEDETDDSRSTATTTMAPTSDPTSRLAAPKIVRIHQHRRQTVAATVWGPHLPGARTPEKFGVYKAILRHPNLFFQFAIRLSPKAMMDLYAIDKEFHYRFNKYSTSIITDFAEYHAPEAAYVFSWALFPNLCISDPMLRPMDSRPHLARDIPSLRWTKLVFYRDEVVRDILRILAVQGLRVPQETDVVLMKFWLLMEMNTTGVRESLLTDKSIWSDQDFYFFHLFLVKLDMYFNHPISGHGFCDLSHMLLTQKSLSALLKNMTQQQTMDYDDATDLMVRTYHVDELDTDTHPWLVDEEENGVDEDYTGLLSQEGWDFSGKRMFSPVDQVSMEAIKRGLDIHRYLLDFSVYGFIDPETKQNLPVPRRWRGIMRIVLPSEGRPVQSAMDDLIAAIDRKYVITQDEGHFRRRPVPQVAQQATHRPRFVAMWYLNTEDDDPVEGSEDEGCSEDAEGSEDSGDMMDIDG